MVVRLFEVVPQALRRRPFAVVCPLVHVQRDAGVNRVAVRHERVVEVEQHDG